MPTNIFSKFHFHLPHHGHRHGKFHIDEHNSLYITNTIRALAAALIGVFLPIYIFTISENFLLFHPNPNINGISWVLSYFLLRSVFTWVSILLFGDAIFSKIHFQLSMIFSFLILIVEILLWQMAAQNLFLILLAGALAGIKVTFYWIPYHIFFLRKVGGKKDAKMGKRTSLRFFLVRISSAIAPAVGGLIITNFGFNVLFSVSIGLLILAAFPIAFVIHDWKHKKHNMVHVVKRYLLNPKLSRLTVGYMGQGAEEIIYLSFWSLLLLFVLKDFTSIGYLNSLSFMISSIGVLLIGRLIDRHGTKRIHSFGSTLNSLLYIPRIFLNNATLFFSLDMVDRFLSGTFALPIMSLSYDKAKKLGGSDFLIYREMSLHSGIILMTSTIMLVIQALVAWRWVFAVAMVASLLTIFLELDEN